MERQSCDKHLEAYNKRKALYGIENYIIGFWH